MQCHRAPLLRHSACRHPSRVASSDKAVRRQTPRIACQLGAGRSGWPLRQSAVEVRHHVEQVFHNMSDAIRTSPPARLLDSAYRPVQRLCVHQYERFAYAYAEFTSEETKRKWMWSRQMVKEARFWRSVVTFLAAMLATMLWEALTPVSVLWGFIVPAMCQWAVYDRPIMNPVSVALMLMLPYKFVPGATIHLF